MTCQTCANQIDDGDRQSVREHSKRQAADAEGEGISRLLDAIDVRKLRGRWRFLEHRVRLDDTELGGVSLNCERDERECDMRRHAEQQGRPDRQQGADSKRTASLSAIQVCTGQNHADQEACVHRAPPSRIDVKVAFQIDEQKRRNPERADERLERDEYRD